MVPEQALEEGMNTLLFIGGPLHGQEFSVHEMWDEYHYTDLDGTVHFYHPGWIGKQLGLRLPVMLHSSIEEKIKKEGQ